MFQAQWFLGVFENSKYAGLDVAECKGDRVGWDIRKVRDRDTWSPGDHGKNCVFSLTWKVNGSFLRNV